MVRRDANRRSSKGEISLLLRASIMLLVGENHVRKRSNESEGHMLYTHSNGGRGRGRARGRFGRKTEAIEEPSK